MGEKIVVGPINSGLVNSRKPFVINNDSFPVLINAYQWRGRVKRKRGTSLLNRLRRYFDSTKSAFGSTLTSIPLTAGSANLISGFSLQSNANIVPGSVTITNTTSGRVYTDPGLNGVLVGAPNGSGTINYASGQITTLPSSNNNVQLQMAYYPDLPVLGLEDLTTTLSDFPFTIAFDTTYSYNISTTFPYTISAVNFYLNPATGAYPGYTQKTNWTPVTWNGQNYQQFWTVNYQGALWATNGVNVPFNESSTNNALPFKAITVVDNITGGPPAIADLSIASHGLVVGDFVFVNEVATTTGINFQTGYVTNVVNANKVTVEFPNATIATAGTGGIAIYLTSRPDLTKDCIRWYNGNPTNNDTPTTFITGNGWVNFCPPLMESDFSIGDLPSDQYYLVGAKLIIPFKDRLLFLGPVVQSSTGNPKYLQDTVVYSQNGTPFYTCSFTGSSTASTTQFNPILVPTNQISTAPAYFSDIPGFGGFVTAGLDQAITTVSSNEDILMLGFNPSFQVRFVYTGNDIVPFNFFVVNSEFGSSSTFSAVNLDKGAITRGPRGFTIASQVDVSRIDDPIPDQVFQINLLNNGNERMSAQRDFINEWIYFTYPSENLSDDTFTNMFPNQTLLYNYRDGSWAIFNECYTTYGSFKRRTGLIWSNVGSEIGTWAEWNQPWNSGSSNLLQPVIICGNQQGFVFFRDLGTGEEESLYIQNIVGNTVTSPDHGLNEGDFIVLSGILGMKNYNGLIYRVGNITENTFHISEVNPQLPFSGTYIGGGYVTRIYNPFIQTKQFPVSWGDGRKTRLGVQRYLLTSTDESQISLYIYLSQDSTTIFNGGTIVPDLSDVDNSGLIYSQVLYTCPESTNLGLTAPNTNLLQLNQISSNNISVNKQQQIWHRVNTSLLGDTVQLAFSLSRDQLGNLKSDGIYYDITGASKSNPCVLTTTAQIPVGTLILISGVVGMTQLNNNYFSVTASDSTTVTIDVDSTAFSTYSSGGSLTIVRPVYQFSEIELHGFILDVSPSGLLA